MKLLICAQSVDRNDPILGFFCRWIEELAKRCEKVTVICLKEGIHSLPANVRVYSLGKEKKEVSSPHYAWRFLRLMGQLRKEYDTVLVHMNQEYVLLGGLGWRLRGKSIYFWRNHYAGSRMTDIAALFCKKIFYTSKFSYTAKYKKAARMPVGIDTGLFKPDDRMVRAPRTILFLARLTHSKRPELLLEALGVLGEPDLRVSLYGPGDEAYIGSLRKKAEALGLSDASFHPGIPPAETPNVYRTHDVFVNCSRSGMLDKTLFEAAACGCLVLASSEDWRELAQERFSFRDGDARDLAEKLYPLLALSAEERRALAIELRAIAESHGLEGLAKALIEGMCSIEHTL